MATEQSKDNGEKGFHWWQLGTLLGMALVSGAVAGFVDGVAAGAGVFLISAVLLVLLGSAAIFGYAYTGGEQVERTLSSREWQLVTGVSFLLAVIIGPIFYIQSGTTPAWAFVWAFLFVGIWAYIIKAGYEKFATLGS